MFGTKCLIVLLVFLALCACLIIAMTVVSADDGSRHHQNAESQMRHKQLVQATLNWRTAKLHGLGRRIPIVTVDTRVPDPFIPMLGVQGLEMCNVGVHGDWYSMLSKNEMLLDWFDDQLAKYRDELVIVVDAGDVVYGGCDIEKLLATYKRISRVSGGAAIIASAELTLRQSGLNHSAPGRYAELRERRQTLLKEFSLGDDPWHVGKPGNASRPNCLSVNGSSCEPEAYEFMDYGFLMGTVGALHELLSFVVNTVPPGFVNKMQGFLDPAKRVGDSNDQDVAAAYMFRNPGELTLDYAMGFTGSLHGMPKKLMQVKDGHVWNRVTKAEQCFIHFNGDSSGRLASMLERLNPTPDSEGVVKVVTEEFEPLDDSDDAGR